MNDGSPLVRYVCGYTLAIFQEDYSDIVDSEAHVEMLREFYQRETNDFVRTRTALLLSGGVYDDERFPELDPSYLGSQQALAELLEAPSILEAYEKVLSLNREHPAVLAEAIRMLTSHICHGGHGTTFLPSVTRYLLESGFSHEKEEMQRMALWSVGRLLEASLITQKPQIVDKTTWAANRSRFKSVRVLASDVLRQLSDRPG